MPNLTLMKREPDKSPAPPILLMLLAFAIRLIWVRYRSWVGGDGPEYLALAKNLVFHGVFSFGDDPANFSSTAFRPPLYPAFVAGLWWGDTPPVLAVMILQAALGAVTVLIVYLIARDSFNNKVALIAGIGMAFAPMSGRFAALILTETVFTFLLALGVLFWGRKKWVVAGAVFGFSALTRPAILPLLLCLPLLGLLPAWRPRWRGHLIILFMAIMVIIPWTARNTIVFGRLMPITSSGWGTNLLFGTLEVKMINDDVWTTALNSPVVKVEGITDEVDADRERLRRAVNRIVADPVLWLRVRATQYPRLFIDSGDYLLGQRNVKILDAWRRKDWLVILVKVMFVLGSVTMPVLAVIGTLVERKRLAQVDHIWLIPLFLAVAHLPAWVEARYFLPAAPMMTILAANGLVWLISHNR
jgi:4-amino-4-deoxy-L-arabinose transferase-like glycosyltransferase